jgi:hypothetical protein
LSGRRKDGDEVSGSKKEKKLKGKKEREVDVANRKNVKSDKMGE